MAGDCGVRARRVAASRGAAGRAADGAARLQGRRRPVRGCATPPRRDGVTPGGRSALGEGAVSRCARRRSRHPDDQSHQPRACSRMRTWPPRSPQASTTGCWRRGCAPSTASRARSSSRRRTRRRRWRRSTASAHDPGMVQVLMGSATESPLGRRQYHPIYEACARHDLPLALHLGGEGAGMSPPSTAVGHPSTYFEWYAAIPQNYMAHITSMVTEGVFEKFPTLQGRALRGRRLLAAAHHVALRQELEGAARRDAVGEGAAERLHPPPFLLVHLSLGDDGCGAFFFDPFSSVLLRQHSDLHSLANIAIRPFAPRPCFQLVAARD